MTALSQNHSDFAARLSRIERSAGQATQLLFVGVDEVYTVSRRERLVKRSRGQVLLGNLMYPVSLVAAVLLGAVSHGLGQVALYHVQGLPDLKANPDITALTQIGLGLAIAMVLGYVVGLNNRALITLKSAGVVAGLLFGHNAVFLYPKLFAALTSQMWVNQVVSHTKFHALMWRGISFVF